MGRSFCLAATEDGPSFLFEPSVPLLLDFRPTNPEKDVLLPRPEGPLCSGPSTPDAIAPDVNLVLAFDNGPVPAQVSPSVEGTVASADIPVQEFIAAF